MFLYLTLCFNTDRVDLQRGKKSFALSNHSIYYACENIKSSYNNNKFKTLASTGNDKFELPDKSYSISGIQDYFEYILKQHGVKIGNHSIRTYAIKSKIELHLKSKQDIILSF